MNKPSFEEMVVMPANRLGKLLIDELSDEYSDPDFEYVKELLVAGASLSSRDIDYDRTPLHLAALAGWPNVVKELIAAGANLEDRDGCNETALHTAAGQGVDTTVVTLLISAGADLEVGSNQSWTPLHKAAYIGLEDNIMILLAAGASKTALDEYGETPWDMADEYIRTQVPELNPKYNE